MNEPLHFTQTLDRIIELIPEGETELLKELRLKREKLFLVLPELVGLHWQDVSVILNRHLADREEPWVDRLLDLWRMEHARRN